MDINQIINQFPKVTKLLSQGMSYEQIFRELCKQRGVDADAFIKQLKDTMK